MPVEYLWEKSRVKRRGEFYAVAAGLGLLVCTVGSIYFEPNSWGIVKSENSSTVEKKEKRLINNDTIADVVVRDDTHIKYVLLSNPDRTYEKCENIKICSDNGLKVFSRRDNHWYRIEDNK